MNKRFLKKYEEYAVDYELAKDFDQKQISQKQIKNSYKNKYEKLYVDYLLMKDVVDDFMIENLNDVIISLKNSDFENDVQNFYNSFNKSKRIQYLSPYTINDLKKLIVIN
jgi:hypothetical protein